MIISHIEFYLEYFRVIFKNVIFYMVLKHVGAFLFIANEADYTCKYCNFNISTSLRHQSKRINKT